MPILIAILLIVFTFVSPMAVAAQSADVESVVKSINAKKSTLTLEDGKTYTVPAEFNFDGLSAGVKVIVYYTVVDGVRVIDDLQVMN
ncbi:DUF1344 domain-containing protein [Rhizobium sp.]|jgi:hypothetical protein|uniref:DUF1344 domain-containing protein n=1 Tax=Rhizobium sp. TaxID=391 RepID=UPI000E9872B2|nr:hypothetical protein [Rhizobium sp.]